MFPTVKESKEFFNEKEVVSSIFKANKNPMDLLIWANKYFKKDEKS